MPMARQMPKPDAMESKTETMPQAARDARENTRSRAKSAPIATIQMTTMATATSGMSPPTDSSTAKSIDFGVNK
jgi:hypothetical protein